MSPFTAGLWDADHLVFDHVAGTLDSRDDQATPGTTGSFEVHEGGILGGGISPLPDRTFRLVFDDGRAWQIRINRVHASDSAGIARVDFRIDVGDGLTAGQETSDG
jgi:hypothetical protein